MNEKRSDIVNGKLRTILEFSRELDGSLGVNHDDEIGNKKITNDDSEPER